MANPPTDNRLSTPRPRNATTTTIGDARGTGTECGACLDDLATLIAEETQTTRTGRPLQWQTHPPTTG